MQLKARYFGFIGYYEIRSWFDSRWNEILERSTGTISPQNRELQTIFFAVIPVYKLTADRSYTGQALLQIGLDYRSHDVF